MIFYLDRDPHKAVKALAVEHLKETTLEALQVLCDATRLLADECRTNAIERKMRDVKANVKPREYYQDIEAKVPRPYSGDNDALVQWVTEGQDSWDWFFDFLEALIDEQQDLLKEGCEFETIRAAHWIFVDAPRPVHAGRIYPRTSPFPISKNIPLDILIDGPGSSTTTKIEQVYRKHYYMTYRNKVTYSLSRKPWWWAAFESIEKRTLASAATGT